VKTCLSCIKELRVIINENHQMIAITTKTISGVNYIDQTSPLCFIKIQVLSIGLFLCMLQQCSLVFLYLYLLGYPRSYQLFFLGLLFYSPHMTKSSRAKFCPLFLDRIILHLLFSCTSLHQYTYT